MVGLEGEDLVAELIGMWSLHIIDILAPFHLESPDWLQLFLRAVACDLGSRSRLLLNLRKLCPQRITSYVKRVNRGASNSELATGLEMQLFLG